VGAGGNGAPGDTAAIRMSESRSVHPVGKPLPDLWQRGREVLSSISWTDFALFCLFAAIAFQYDVVKYPLQMALVEPVGWATLIFLLLRKGAWSGIRGAAGRSISLLLVFLTIWTFAIWLVDPTWRYGLDDVRWIFLSVAVLITLLGTVRDWRRALVILLVVAALAAAIADFQGLTGAFVPPFSSNLEKELYLPQVPGQVVRVAAGFFGNSNMFGGFVFWPLLISIGLALGRKLKWVAALGAVFFAASLYLSDARGVEAGFLRASALIALSYAPFPAKGLRYVILTVIVATMAGAVLLVVAAPRAGFFSTLWLRVNLWQAALGYFRRFPTTLLLGAGSGLKIPPTATWAEVLAPEDPHNLYLYATMHYGLPGLLIMIAVGWKAIALGWQRYKRGELAGDPLLRSVWAAWLAFPVMGGLDSYFNKVEWQLILLLALGFWLKLGADAPPRAGTDDPI